MLTADVKNIIRLRINSDGEGVRSVVFMHGCPLNCFWCCNPEARYTENYKTLTAQQLNEYIRRDKPYFIHSNGGITFSGGEPLIYAGFIEKFIEEFCRDISVDIETSLYTDKENLLALVPLIDEWYIDFKVFDEKKHVEYTGVSNERIKDNISFLSRAVPDGKIIITYPIIPGFNTSEKDIKAMIGFLKDTGLRRISFHPYRKDAEEKHKQLGLPFEIVSEVDTETYNIIKDIFQTNGFETVTSDIKVEKEKCSYLKAIRKSICANNGIRFDIEDCNFEGRCIGTCPKCEDELDIINDFLEINKDVK